jgi:cell pole-organizing protein PopZ
MGTTAMSEPENQSEPSMDDILASIRKIISEEGPEGAQGAQPAGDGDEEVLELTQVVKDDGSLSELDREGAGQGSAAQGGTPTSGGLVSSTAAAAATSSIAELAGSLRREPPSKSVIGGGKPLDALVREALDPYLRAWLDANLGKLVDRVVREEIQKLVRRGEDGNEH